MYQVVLFLHSWVRWIVAIAAVAAVARALVGWLVKKEWTKLDDQLGLVFSTSLDVQMLLGLILYLFLSPIMQAAFKNLGAAMSDATLRFFTVEHILYMVAAVVLAHVGRAMAKRAVGATAKHRLTTILFGLATLAILIAVPWPFTAVGAGRPWFRL